MKLFHPPHIYQNNTIYFITAKTINSTKFFENGKKDILYSTILFASEKFRLEIVGLVVLSNHYHTLINVDTGEKIYRFIKNIHTNSSRMLNMKENQKGRKIWYQYWDRCIRSEKDLLTRLNYIHYNPLKHGYTAKIEEYKWSTYRNYLEKFGIEWLSDCFLKYPIKDFSIECDD